MRGSELRYGLAVALVLLAIAVFNFVIRHGPGAPQHPPTGLAVIGLIAALAVFPLLLTRNRFIVPFGAVIAAFFVTLPRGPSALQTLHAVAIVFPLVYALVLTQRQRKAAMAEARARRSAGGGTRGAARGGKRSIEAGGRRRGDSSQKGKNEQPAGPRPNRRYTPPKARRARR